MVKVGEDLAVLSIVNWEGVIRKSNNPAFINKKFQVQGLKAQEALKGKEWEGLRKNEKGKWVYTELLPITNSAQELARIAIDLKDMVDKFKLRPEKNGPEVKYQASLKRNPGK